MKALNYEHGNVIDITNIRNELISIATTITRKDYTRNNCSLNNYVDYSDFFYYGIDHYNMINIDGIELPEYDEELTFEFDSKCHIPLELIIIYYRYAEVYREIKLIFYHNIIITIMANSVDINYGNKYYHNCDSKWDLNSLNDHFLLNKNHKMSLKDIYDICSNAPYLGDVLKMCFSQEFYTPTNMYRRLMKHWKIKKRYWIDCNKTLCYLFGKEVFLNSAVNVMNYINNEQQWSQMIQNITTFDSPNLPYIVHPILTDVYSDGIHIHIDINIKYQEKSMLYKAHKMFKLPILNINTQKYICNTIVDITNIRNEIINLSENIIISPVNKLELGKYKTSNINSEDTVSINSFISDILKHKWQSFISEEVIEKQYFSLTTTKQCDELPFFTELELHESISLKYIDDDEFPHSYCSYKLIINMKTQCHIPLELLLIYYHYSEQFAVVKIVFDNIAIKIYPYSATITYMDTNGKKYYHIFDTMLQDEINDYYHINYTHPMITQGCYETGPLVGHVLNKCFSQRMFTPQYVCYRLLTAWNMEYNIESLAENMHLPFLFLPHENPNVINTYIIVKNQNLKDVKQLTFAQLPYTFRPCYDMIHIEDDAVQINIQIVPNSILEDNVVFDINKRVRVFSHPSLYGLNHIYSYINILFDSNNEMKKQELLKRFNVINYTKLINILDRVSA